jgi:predicted permease
LLDSLPIICYVGLFCTSIPDIRSIFVDIIYRQGNAPLQWFFDGLYEVGLAAVPINMIILGCNLSASYMIQSPESKLEIGESGENEESSFLFSNSVSVLVVIGKMICMPIIGFISTYLLSLIYTIPEEIAGGIYLVLLIVFLCPTANNVMVMIELASSGGNGSGPSLKEGMARIIAYQYAVSPLLLSGTVTGAVLMATYLGGNNGDGNGEE